MGSIKKQLRPKNTESRKRLTSVKQKDIKKKQAIKSKKPVKRIEKKSERKTGRTNRGKANNSMKKTNKKRKIPTKKADKNIPKLKLDPELLEETKSIWKLDFKSLSKPQREREVGKYLEKFKGSLSKLCLKPSSARCLEVCIKHSRNEDKIKIYDELSPSLLQLCCDRYSGFVVISMINHSESIKNLRERFYSFFEENGKNLLSHRHGSLVFDSFYRTCTPKKRFALLRSATFPPALVPSDKSLTALSLKQLLGHEVKIRDAILQNFSRVVENVVMKEMLTTAFSHELIYEYIMNTEFSRKKDLLSRLVAFPLLLAQTKVGCKLAVLVFTYCEKKQKKEFIKLLKGKVEEMVQDDYGWLILYRCLELTDDTVLTNTLITKILATKANDFIGNKNFQKLTLHLLNPTGKRFSSPEENALLFSTEPPQNANPKAASTLELDHVATLCKKPCAKKREEVLASFFPSIVDAAAPKAQTLARTAFGRELLFELGFEEIQRQEDVGSESVVASLLRILFRIPQSPQVAVLSGIFARLATKAKSIKTTQSLAEGNKGGDSVAKVFLDDFEEKFGRGHELEKWLLSPAVFSLIAVIQNYKVIWNGKGLKNVILTKKRELIAAQKTGTRLLLELLDVKI